MSPQELVAQQRREFETLLGGQKAEQAGLFGQFEQRISGQEKLPVLYQRLQKEQGIPELKEQAGVFRGQIFKTKDLLDRLDEDVTARTSGTFTTEAQRRRQIAAEGEPLRTQLGRLGTGLEPISQALTAGIGEVSTLLGLTSQEQERELEPLKLRVNALSDRFAREITGFTQTRQNELTALLDKLENERRLEQREWERVQQLAAEEREFARQKALAARSASNAGEYLRPLSGGGTPSGIAPKPGGGFAFTDPSGKPVSAAKYAEISGIPLGNLLSDMARQGDTTAGRAYNWLRSIQGSSLFKSGKFKQTPAYKKTFSSIFWGT